MRASTTAFALASLLGLSFAAPRPKAGGSTPVDLAARCGQTLVPTFLQQLTESNPTAVNPNTLSTNGDFLVSQTVDAFGNVGNRVYQVVAFENIPAGSYGCQLNYVLPPSASVTITGNPTLNITTLYNDDSGSITFPNTYSWDTFFPPPSPPFGQGLFGTSNFVSGGSAVINSEGCPVGGGNLAFVFSIASWISESASIEFDEYVNVANGAGLTGVYLTLDC